MQAFIRQKKIDNEVKINKEIPDIAGNLGYPPRFEPSYEQVKKATKKELHTVEKGALESIQRDA